MKTPSRARTAPGVMDARALNRALLARQMLLHRWDLPAEEAVERLVGLQAQAQSPPYLGLWTRLQGFRHEDLGRLLTERRVVRVALMRGTLHLVTARDCLSLRPLLQPVLDRGLHTGSPHGRRLAGMDMAALAAAGRALVEQEPLTSTALGQRLRERWPDRDAGAMAQAIRALVPLVQVPPRGLWGVGGLARCTTAESWLGRPLASDTSLDDVVMRYLAAFGPATVKDVQTWSGLTQLRDRIERLRPRLCTFRDERGDELFDLPDAPRPDRDTPAPARFLPEYDNALLAHDDRRRIVADEHRARLCTVNGVVPGTVLVDGRVGGMWKIERQRDTATLVIEPFARLSKQDRTAVSEEGTRLLAFAAGDARVRGLRFTRPG